MSLSSSNQVVDPYATADNLIPGLSSTFCVDALIRRVVPPIYPMRVGNVCTTFSDGVVTLRSILA